MPKAGVLTKIIIIIIIFSVREQGEFNKSCNLIGSGSGWKFFPSGPLLAGRNIKNVSSLSENLLNDLCYYVNKNFSVKPPSST